MEEVTHQPRFPGLIDYPAVIVSALDVKQVGRRSYGQPAPGFSFEIGPWPWPYCSAFSLTIDCDGPFGAHGGSKTAERAVVPYLAETLQSKGLQATFFVVGGLAEEQPDIVEKLMQTQQDIGGHGYLHRRLDGLSQEQQREDIRKTVEAIKFAGGPKIQGWRSPMGTVDGVTYQILLGEGFRWASNRFLPLQAQLPFNPIIEGNLYGLIEMPFESSHTDMELYGRRKVPPETAELIWLNHVLWARQQGTLFLLLNHPINLEPEPQRVKVLGTLVEKIQRMGDVWVASCSQVVSRWNMVQGLRLNLLEIKEQMSRLRLRLLIANSNPETFGDLSLKVVMPRTISGLGGHSEGWFIPQGTGLTNTIFIRLPLIEALGSVEAEFELILG